MKNQTLTKKRKTTLHILLAFPILLLLIAALSAISNLWAPSSSSVVDHLDELQKARVAEMLNLRHNLGNEVWTGFGDADIPMIVWNESYAFLIGLKNPPAGWITFPGNEQKGSPWEAVTDDDFYGQTYYRQRLPSDGTNPQAFTNLVGQHWAASLQTKEWMLISLSEQIRNDFGPIFPHWLFARVGMGSSERYISPGLLHESFHAFQGLTVPARLQAGELASRSLADGYPWEDASFQTNWQAELDVLAKALQAKSDLEAAEFAKEFLSIRANRRTTAMLSADQVEFENQREWVEGLAKYTDIATWKLAYTSKYSPIPEILSDPDFDGYRHFPQYWQTELSNLTKRANDEGDGRFYYTGMAQAFLLDRLMPEWKTQILKDNIWLEGLLAKAVSGK